MLYVEAVERAMQHLERRGRRGPTLNAYRADLRLYARYVSQRSGIPAGQLTLRDCAAVGLRTYMQHLREERRNVPATISRRLAALRALYGDNWRAAGLNRDPSREIAYPRGSRGAARSLNAALAERIVRAAALDSSQPLRDILMLVLLVGNGLTLAELTAIDRRDVNLERRLLNVRARPRAERTVPISAAAARLLRRHVESLPEGPLWVNRSGGRLSPRGVQYVCARAARKAGLEGQVSVQSLRVTALRLMREAGASDETIRDLLGLRRAC